jgi:dicarboxylate--CoA ligase PimA
MQVGRPYAWEKSYPAGVRWDSPIATSTLQELLDRAVADYGDRPALEYQDRRISYRGLGDQAARAAAAFQHIGIDRGHAVALYMPNTPWHPIVFFGVLRTGAHIVHLSPLDAERELIHKLTDSGARTVVTVNLFGLDAKALKLAAGGHVDRVIVADDGVWASYPLMGSASAFGHPPLEGEGRTAKGGPGWGGSDAADDGDSVCAEALSPPPGPPARSDLPPAEPRYSEGSAAQNGDRSRQQPTSVGGGDGRRRARVDWPAGAEPFSLELLMAETPTPSHWPPVSADDIALLQYTGATTGVPKAAVLTHANLTAAVSSYRIWIGGQRPTGAPPDRVLAVLPLFHIYGLVSVMLRHLASGNELLLRSRFDIEEVLRDIEVNRVTAFPGVPTMWAALVNHPGIEQRDLSSLRACASGGAPLPVEVAERFGRISGLPLPSGWGMTETAPAGASPPLRGPAKPGTIGLPLPGITVEVVALDDPHRVLGPSEVGELRVKGKNVMQRYWNRPDETAAAFADGGFLSGDIGTMDDDGYFFILDRKKDMILSGGFNVYPQVIEQAIYEHPDVEEALVIGVPDPYRGEAAKAFIKLRSGASPLTLDTLKDFLADKIGRHEMPAALEIRTALPRTSVGKLSKKELIEEERCKGAHDA